VLSTADLGDAQRLRDPPAATKQRGAVGPGLTSWHCMRAWTRRHRDRTVAGLRNTLSTGRKVALRLRNTPLPERFGRVYRGHNSRTRAHTCGEAMLAVLAAFRGGQLRGATCAALAEQPVVAIASFAGSHALPSAAVGWTRGVCLLGQPHAGCRAAGVAAELRQLHSREFVRAAAAASQDLAHSFAPRDRQPTVADCPDRVAASRFSNPFALWPAAGTRMRASPPPGAASSRPCSSSSPQVRGCRGCKQHNNKEHLRCRLAARRCETLSCAGGMCCGWRAIRHVAQAL
jgi:hypothetical protein